MEHKPQTNRPSLEQALSAWQQLLADRKFPTDLVWVFDENLCFEKDPKTETGFRLGFQTRLTPPPPEAHRVAYEHFAESGAPLVWYRLGSHGGKSICMLLCDPWFQAKTEVEGFVSWPEWLTLFWPG